MDAATSAVPTPNEDDPLKTTATTTTYDVDLEHAYIMSAALRSYKEHKDGDEEAERPVTRPNTADQTRLLKRARMLSAELSRQQQRPKTGNATTRCQRKGQVASPSPASTPRSPSPDEISKSSSKDAVIIPCAPMRSDSCSSSLTSSSTSTTTTGRSTPILEDVARVNTAPCSPVKTRLTGRRLTRSAGPLRFAKLTSSPTKQQTSRAHPLGHARVGLSLSCSSSPRANSPVDPIREVGVANHNHLHRARSAFSESSSGGSSTGRSQVSSDGGLFRTIRSPRRLHYNIHPEWVSETMSVQKMSLQERTPPTSYPPRRCKSAPPPRSRNPITWENFSPTRHRPLVRSCPNTRNNLSRNPITWDTP